MNNVKDVVKGGKGNVILSVRHGEHGSNLEDIYEDLEEEFEHTPPSASAVVSTFATLSRTPDSSLSPTPDSNSANHSLGGAWGGVGYDQDGYMKPATGTITRASSKKHEKKMEEKKKLDKKKAD